MAWELGVKKLVIQSDSRTAISILSSEENATHQHMALAFEFRDLRFRQ
ncbi:hypothetical protein LINPERHAP1_LOCUS7604 [Linum perenne]